MEEYYYGVPEELIQKGILELYEDDSDELIPAIKNYNEHAKECRIKYKEVNQTCSAFYIVTPVLIALIMFLDNNSFMNYWLNLAVWLAGFIWFGVKKRNMMASAALTLPLFFITPIFLIVTAFDAVLAYRYKKLDEPLRSNPTYPLFTTIDIKYRRGKRSQFHDADERL